MVRLLYDLGIRIYYCLILAASIFNTKAAQFIRGRKSILKKIEASLAKSQKPIAWFHCASLGEFEQGRPVIEAFKENFSQFDILVTFYSPSGYEIRKDYAGAEFVFYLPMDTYVNAKRFISIVQPSLCIFIKYEFWINYLTLLKKNNISALSISAIFRPEQAFFHWWGSIYLKVLKSFEHIFVQDETSLQILYEHHIENASLSGDTRFDRVAKICEETKPISFIPAFKGDSRLFIVGSSWPEDMAVIRPLINAYPELKFIIAPHEVEEKNIHQLINQLPEMCLRFSKLESNSNYQAQIMIMDRIGLLSALYQYGDFAYIGGAFGHGLHNILEAVTFGLPVFFGNKNYKKFKEANDLIENNGAFAVKDFQELDYFFHPIYKNKESWEKINQINRHYIRTHTGATNRIINYCEKHLAYAGESI